jgi:hypothetical protein
MLPGPSLFDSPQAQLLGSGNLTPVSLSVWPDGRPPQGLEHGLHHAAVKSLWL